jgi:orotate phosphoribosyltransferase-like protein
VVNKLSPEREQLKEHAITLRKQGWTEQAIANDLGVKQRTLSHWLVDVLANNATLGNVAKGWKSSQNRTRNNVAINPLYIQRA